MTGKNLEQAKSPYGHVFRRAYIKRRLASTGLFESGWTEITEDVMKWGSFSSKIDSVRVNTFSMANAKITLDNTSGRYNPYDHDASLWFGFTPYFRSLVRLEFGFIEFKKVNGVWTQIEVPVAGGWDEGLFDSAIFDSGDKTSFVGIIYGDMSLSEKNEVVMNISPLTQVFRDFAAQNLTGWDPTGLTAQEFVEMLRDQTDGSANFIFRPFFGDTTSNWDIASTTVNYTNLNTSGAEDVVNNNCWEILATLAEAENLVPRISRDGKFSFSSRSPATTTVAFEFHGLGTVDPNYGNTIKRIDKYGPRLSKLYTRVQVQWSSTIAEASYEVVESTMTVNGNNLSWLYGQRTLNISNFYIPDSTIANQIATTIFNEYSALKKEIEFTSTFSPQIDITDMISVSYDPNVTDQGTLWDVSDWANTSTSSDGLIWSDDQYSDLYLVRKEFKILSMTHNLDNLETKIIGREA